MLKYIKSFPKANVNGQSKVLKTDTIKKPK